MLEVLVLGVHPFKKKTGKKERKNFKNYTSNYTVPEFLKPILSNSEIHDS